MIDGEGTPADAIDLTPVEANENYNYGMVANVRLRTTGRIIFVTLLPNAANSNNTINRSNRIGTAVGFGDWIRVSLYVGIMILDPGIPDIPKHGITEPENISFLFSFFLSFCSHFLM